MRWLSKSFQKTSTSVIAIGWRPPMRWKRSKAMDMVEGMFRHMNPSILYDLQKYHPRAFNRFLKHKNDYLYSVVRSNLERGITEELYRDDINIDLLSKFRVESIMMFFNPDFLGNQKMNFGEVQQK